MLITSHISFVDIKHRILAVLLLEHREEDLMGPV